MTLEAIKPLSCELLLRTLDPLHTPQIENVEPTTDIRLPDVSICRSLPTAFPLPPVQLPPQASPMSHILTASLASALSDKGTQGVSLYSLCHCHQNDPQLQPIQYNCLHRLPIQNCQYPSFFPLSSNQCSQSPPD